MGLRDKDDYVKDQAIRVEEYGPEPAVEHAYDVILKRRGGCEIFVRTYCGKTLNDVMAMLSKSYFDNVEIIRIIDSETKDILWDRAVSKV